MSVLLTNEEIAALAVSFAGQREVPRQLFGDTPESTAYNVARFSSHIDYWDRDILVADLAALAGAPKQRKSLEELLDFF